jgi:lipid II:glycine glycyltransferase (peptidoglycan interpeptide bridge formation enzyme)
LKNELISNSTPGLLLAIRQGSELVAATFVVIHGDTATYLLGWSGDIGRKISAHYLLLWENLIRLKKQNIHYFDLGGIDEEKTPSIAAFKLGIGGERYQLVGEGWCW